MASVAESGGIASHPFEAGPSERRFAEALLERRLVHCCEGGGVGSRDMGAGREPLVLRGGRKADVPRAHVLADVTAEQPLADLGALAVREFSAVLDREIRNARARIEIAGRDECLRRACVETAGAGAAAIGLKGQIGLE